jgi:UDP-GlcNAc:undecaprenyl-phosphate GlcNAc-1-phosphate transferase
MDPLFVKSGLLAFVVSLILTPFLIKVSRQRGFYAYKDHRSSHIRSVPNTGGIVLCFAILIPLIAFSSYSEQEDYSFLLSAFAVLLITGIIDDLSPLPVVFKFLGQFIPAIVIVMSVRQQDLVVPYISHLADVPSFFNYFFWIIFIVMSINAFNLIDGIDGLAISLGIVGGVFYFYNFLVLEKVNLCIFSAVLVGGLIGLLIYNYSSKWKIFIGDTGSLLIGGLLVFFGLNFINLETDSTASSSFFKVLGTFFIPFADMIRVAISRVVDGQSPFKADRRHIHHLVVDACGGNHVIATSILVACQILITFGFSVIYLSNDMHYLSLTIAFISAYLILVLVLRKTALRDREATNGANIV